MKKSTLFLILVLSFATTSWAQFGHVPVAMFKVVGDTSVINKSVGRAYHYTDDNLYYVGAGTYLKQIATEGDSISLSTISVDTLYGRTTDSIFVKDDLILLRDVLFSGTSSNMEYWIDTSGDTVLVIDPNASGGPSLYMMDATGVDTVRFYHNGTDFVIWPDAGTGKIDLDGTVEADSLRSEDGNFVFSPTTDKTTMLMARLTDSLYVGKTSRFVGVVTVQDSAFSDTLTSNMAYIVTLHNDSLDSRELTVTDSTFSDTLTSNMAYLVTIHNDSLDTRELTVTDSVFADTARINMAYLTTIAADSMDLRELTVTDSAFVDTLTTSVLRVTGKAVIEDSARVNKTFRAIGAATFGATATPAYISATGLGAFGGVAINSAYSMYVGSTGVGSPRGIVNRQSSATAGGAAMNFRKSRGTLAAGTVITTADTLGVLNFWGADANEHFVKSASISALSSGTIASTRIPSRLVFATSTDATPSVLTNRMIIDNAGNIGIGIAPTSMLHMFSTGGSDTEFLLDSENANSSLLLKSNTDIKSCGIKLYDRTAATTIVGGLHLDRAVTGFTGGSARNDILVYTKGAHNLHLAPNEAIALTATNNGNIGIGTITPNANSLTLGKKGTPIDLVSPLRIQPLPLIQVFVLTS